MESRIPKPKRVGLGARAQPQADLMFSLNSRVLVVKLVDIKDQLKNKNVKVVTNFAHENHGIKEGDGSEQSREQNNLSTKSKEEVCEVCAETVCSVAECHPSAREATDTQAADCKSNKQRDEESASTSDHKQAKANLGSLVSDSKQCICVHCQKSLYSGSDLRKPTIYFHGGTDVLDYKKQVYKNKDKLTCGICEKRLSSSSSLGQHVRMIHDNIIKKYTCDICNKVFKQKAHLESHQITHSQKKNFKCDLCDKSYKHSTGLVGHKNTVHTIALGIEKKIYFCNKCEKHLSSASSFRVHMMIHDNKNRYVCDICGKGFSQKGNLENHVMLHGEERPFACTLCTSKFKTKKDVVRHQVKHSDVWNYSCDECGDKFKYRSTLNSHAWSHRNSKRYTCDICAYSCNVKSSLKHHKRTHDRSQTFPCDLCGKEFFLQSLLKAHKVYVHSTSTYECERCGKTFSAKQYLRNHMKTHSQLAFHCVCGKTYRSKLSLRNHTVLNNH